MCGTLNAAELPNGVAKSSRYHPHKRKILLLSGLFQRGDVHAGACAVLDLWNKRYDDFFMFCKSPSKYGGFEPPHLRHMMAEEVAKDIIFYRKARDNQVRCSP